MTDPLDTKPPVTSTTKAIVVNTASSGPVAGFIYWLLVHFQVDWSLSDADVGILLGVLTSAVVGICHWIATRAIFQRVFAPATSQ